MAARAKRGNAQQGSSGTGPRKGVKIVRRKSCFFCREKIAEIDYKNIAQLRRAISDRSKIKSRGNTGTCRKPQKPVAVAIKRRREVAPPPYGGDTPAPQARQPRPHSDHGVQQPPPGPPSP